MDDKSVGGHSTIRKEIIDGLKEGIIQDMHISKLRIQNYRNFRSLEVALPNSACVVIGPNDVGKSNVLAALRLLLDPTVSEADLVPKDSDFYAYEPTSAFTIILEFSGATDSIRSRFKECVSDDGDLILKYVGMRDPSTRRRSHALFCGHKDEALEAFDNRFWLKTLSMKYLGVNRDLDSLLRRERRGLLDDARSERSDDHVAADDKSLESVGKQLKKISSLVSKLNYVSTATGVINEQLNQLSDHHAGHSIVLDTQEASPSDFVDNLKLAERLRDTSLLITGDGRSNQVFVALWAARHGILSHDVERETILCIEEPESQLHPHQQRRLARYLASMPKAQTILTSHSPQIACEFAPGAIVRLRPVDDGKSSVAAAGGWSNAVLEAFQEFAYRLDIIPAEAFFSDAVLLVEGVSELMFFKALARDLGIDLDQKNLSILSVEGVGFATYIDLLDKLEIQWTLRTDNDYFRQKGGVGYWAAGASRVASFLERYRPNAARPAKIASRLVWKRGQLERPTAGVRQAVELVRSMAGKAGLFLASLDLERDLIDSPLRPALEQHFQLTDGPSLLAKMCERKCENMYSFLFAYQGKLDILRNHSLALPLHYLGKLGK